jgi:uncharacterized RDD family membrane protein YckC
MNQEKKHIKINLDFLGVKEKPPSLKKKKAHNKTHDVATKPWARYIARFIDIALFSFIFVLILSNIAPEFIVLYFFNLNDTFSTIIILFVWIIVESIFLSTFGATFGKWLLKINLSKKSNNKKLSFMESLNRSIKVWLKGLGAGLPIVTLFTQITAYNTLTSKGETSWDKEGNILITHDKIGFFRGFLAASFIIIVGFLWLGSSI